MNNTAVCGLYSSGVGSMIKVGYVVDPVAQTPKLNQVVYLHAVATRVDSCNAAEEFDIDFFLPAGASFAISAATPVNCYIGNGTTSGAASNCSQSPLNGRFGGWTFGSQTGVAPGWSYEVQVPVIFTQQVAGAQLFAATTSEFQYPVTSPLVASVNVSVPFVAPPPVQPTPNPYAHGKDIALLGSATAGSTLPVAFSNDDGSFTVTSYDVGDFAAWTRDTNVQRISGDFNGDGLTDFTLVGGPSWGKIPVAMSLGNGQFSITNTTAGWFPIWASTPGVKAYTGDFNHDGRTDIALLGGAGWSAIPIAFSNGDGTFNVTNVQSPNFASWAGWSGAKPLVGDFNKDGFDDIALVGGAGWTTVPVAFSYGDGGFLVTNYSAQAGYNGVIPGWNFALLASSPNVTAVTGDFNHDGYTDIALTGGSGWTTLPIAFSYGNGAFALYNQPIANFGAWASTPGAKVLTGDFNGDGYTDLALTGVAGWLSVPVALNLGYGSFSVVNSLAANFAMQASAPGVRAIAADFNGDGYTDIALTGGVSWTTMPVAFSIGWGQFSTTNAAISGFATWSSDTTASALVGRVNN
ncbi:MAG: VCBS repeat-containing protein [Kofleriaceae bacterium]